MSRWPSWQKEQSEGDEIKGILVEKDVSATSKLAKFVTVKAYEEAGGYVRRDMFDAEDKGSLTDAELLNRLASEKLEGIAEKLRAEGWKWVEIKPEFDYRDEQKYGTLTASVPEKAKTRIAEIVDEMHKLQFSEKEEDRERESDLHEEMEKLRRGRSYTKADKAMAGAVVILDRNGKAEVKQGLLTSDDAKAVKAAQKGGEKKSGVETAPKDTGLSAPLVELLTAHWTAGLQAKLTADPKTALVAFFMRSSSRWSIRCSA